MIKFDASKYRVLNVPNGGLAALDINNKLVAYKKKADKDLRNWHWVNATHRKNP